MLTIRLAEPQDAAAISRVHMGAIRVLCRSHYDDQQIEAWASRRTPEFYERVLESQELFVAVRGGEVVALGQIDLESGTIVSVYVAPEVAGTGVGRAMLEHLEAITRMHGWSRVHLTASLNALPFCEKMGYEKVAPLFLDVATGVTLECADMRKQLPKLLPT